MNPCLVVLAAGIGRRFGDLKQIKQVGDHGELIIDYSVKDAIIAGFKRVVFIVRSETIDYFRKTVGSRFQGIQIEYVIQENNVAGFEMRKKPLGTAHALMMCKDIIKSPFMVINADDFYGRSAFVAGYNFLCESEEYGLIGYKLVNTLSNNGKVNRGICKVKNGYLTSIVESSVEKTDGKIIATPLDGSKGFEINNAVVSMGMILFRPSIFKYIEDEFSKFLNDSIGSRDDAEFMLPNVLLEAIKKGEKCKVIRTDSVWSGITYKDDLDSVKKHIERLVKEGLY